MSQLPSELREGHLKEATKVFKTIAPTTLTTTRAQNTPVITAATAATTTNTQPLQKNVPAFLNKLYSMVNDPESDDLICWADDGLSFFVNRQEDFARKVLPRFFKHNKFSSFVRQLNMYGFHKVPHLQQGVLETDNESERWEFSNPHFQRNQPDLLLLVTRKKGPTSSSGNGGHDGEKEISSLDLQHILEEIQSIKKHQLNISTQLQNIQRDNQVLWNETIQARERHLRHQETIDKILRFLASVFSNGEKRHAIPRKRRYLLESGHASGQNGNIEEELMSQPQDEILSTTGSIDNNISNTSSDSNRPTKVPRRQQPSATSSSASTTFNIDDFVNGRSDPSQLSTALPSHVNQNALSSTGSSDLADAIALNNQAKNENPTLTTIPDLSNIANLNVSSIPQLQSLQSLITLAQANPNLLNQLTMDSLFSMPPNSPTTQPKQSSNVSLTQSQAIAQPTTSISTINSNLSTPTSTITSVPNASNDNTINTNTSNSQQIVLPPISAATIHPATSTSTTNDQLIHYGAPATPSLNQVTNNLSSIASSAESINQDIDELGLSLQALAEHLGFDPSKLITEGDSVATNSIANADTGDLIDMDDFLNAYGSDIPDMTSTADTPATPLSAATDTAKVTTTNSTSSATQTPSMPRSPSPAVAGNNLS